VLRDNDLVELPKEIGELSRLRELHIQGNRLSVLPPELGMLAVSCQYLLQKICFLLLIYLLRFLR
jgi:Leucine-rich repeat (LRR) protein